MQYISESTPREASKLIVCLLPDDGSHKALLEALHREKRIDRVETLSCLATGSLADANPKPGTLPDTYLAKMVRVVVPEAEADALFEYIYEKARIGRDGGGVLMQHALIASTPFVLPAGVVEEAPRTESRNP